MQFCLYRLAQGIVGQAFALDPTSLDQFDVGGSIIALRRNSAGQLYKFFRVQLGAFEGRLAVRCANALPEILKGPLNELLIIRRIGQGEIELEARDP